MLEEYYDVPEEIDSKFENIVYPNSWRANSIDEADYSEEYLQIKNFQHPFGCFLFLKYHCISSEYTPH